MQKDGERETEREGGTKRVCVCVCIVCVCLICELYCVLCVSCCVCCVVCVVCVCGVVCTSKSTLQKAYVAVCCSVLQCVAVCCSVLQCVAVCCVVCTSKSTMPKAYTSDDVVLVFPAKSSGAIQKGVPLGAVCAMPRCVEMPKFFF